MDGHEPDVSSLMHPTGTTILERAGDLLVRALPGDKGREKILTVIDQERLLGMGGEKGMWDNVYEETVSAADVLPFVERLVSALETNCSLYTPDLRWTEESRVQVQMRGLRKRVHQRTRLITHKPGDRQWGYVDVSQFSGAGEAYSYQHNVPRAGIVALMQGDVPPHATHHDLADWYDGQEPASVVARYETGMRSALRVTTTSFHYLPTLLSSAHMSIFRIKFWNQVNIHCILHYALDIRGLIKDQLLASCMGLKRDMSIRTPLRTELNELDLLKMRYRSSDLPHRVSMMIGLLLKQNNPMIHSIGGRLAACTHYRKHHLTHTNRRGHDVSQN